MLVGSATTGAAQVRAGTEFRVHSNTLGYQNGSGAAVAGNGDFIVVWTSSETGDSDVRARFFHADGAPSGNEFVVNAYTTGRQYTNRRGTPVAMRPDGRALIVWTSEGQGGDGGAIYARRVNPTGPTGPEFRVSTPGDARTPNVAVTDSGTHLVVWKRSRGPNSSEISGQLIDAVGNRIGTEFRINTRTTGIQASPRVSVDGRGTFVVVWQDFASHDGFGTGVFGQRVDAAGTRVGTVFRVTGEELPFERTYGVASGHDGQFVVVWDAQGDADQLAVMARRFDSNGIPAGSQFVVNEVTHGYQRSPSVGMDGIGNFVVSWQSDNVDGFQEGVSARRFAHTGVPRESQFLVNTMTAGPQRYAVTAVDRVGNFVTAYEGLDGFLTGVFAQRFGGILPTALEVDTVPDADSNGNRVLEPGESVDLRPAWRNVNGVDQTIVAGAADASGGGAPRLTDAAAAYGSIPNGATRTCGDCYELAIDAPVHRPGFHWDVTAVETLSPPSQGQEIRWSLHVGDSFADVPRTSPFYRFVETLLHRGVASSCGDRMYCPGLAVTREQMAPFVLAAKEGPGYAPKPCRSPLFSDVPAESSYCRWIEELARRGIVTGCGGGLFCPGLSVSREQMAVFVLRTVDEGLMPPSCNPPNLFVDVSEASPYCPWIEELARRGVVSGCGGGAFCPGEAATREQMSVYVAGSFGLTLYGR